MNLADVVRDLRRYDEEPVSWQEPSIYAADPWGAQSEAVVEWSMPKGGLPEQAAKRLLYCITGVRKALELLGSDYDRLLIENRTGELCQLLIRRVEETNAQRKSN